MWDIELTLQLLDSALSVEFHQPDLSYHWMLECSPFPLLYVLSQLLNRTLRFVVYFHLRTNHPPTPPPKLHVLIIPVDK